ncbi:g10751 [Coccomyxa elongata]
MCPAADCVTRLTGLAGSCSTQIAAITTLGQSIPVDATDDQIMAGLKGQPAPTAACCTAANTFITGGCRCDTQTVAIVAAQNINTNSLKTLVRATELSCNLPATIDPCK